MCQIKKQNGYVNLGTPNTIWAIPAIHSVVDELIPLHDKILEDIKPGDRIVYLGNYTGYGEHAVACIDEILAFRRLVLSLPGIIPSDIVYLRGMQEEIWSKLLQLQFASNPDDVLLWMLGNGLGATLKDYNISPHDGIDACRFGIMELTRWTQNIRNKIRVHPGHEDFILSQKRAAYTCTDHHASPLLFVHAGINMNKPLQEQGDSLWWEGQSFDTISAPYKPFQKVVRGYDPTHKGRHLNCVTATLDDGCGFGGHLICGQFNPEGHIEAILEL